MTEPHIDHAIESLAEIIGHSTTAIVNLHAAATIDPDHIEYARADISDLQRALNHTLNYLGITP